MSLRRFDLFAARRIGEGAAALLLLAACARAVLTPTPQPTFVGYEERGEASWYGHPFHGRPTASGEVYDMSQLTAAHRTLPMGSRVVVENLLNRRTVEVRITDRGPFKDNRILDLSQAAARVLGAVGPGVIPVRLRVIGLPGSIQRAQSSGAYSVQVASFTSKARALALKNVLDQTWEGTHVQQAEVGGRAVYRVRVGRYASRQEAGGLAERLADVGYAVIVIEE